MKSLFLRLSVITSLVAVPNLAQADIVIGIAGPMTGQIAMFGEQMKQGADLAVAEINEKGGLLGEKVVLEYGDDQCDPKQAVSVANEMVKKKINFVIGHFCSSASMAASDVYNEESIVMMTPASTKVELTERGLENIFRFVGRDDDQGAVAGKYILTHHPDAKVAIVHDKVAYSQGLADATKAYLNANGKQEVFYETITPGEQDYSALVAKLKKENVDILFYGGYHPEAGLIIRQMREQGLNTVLFGGDALGGNEFWPIVGAGGEGTLMTFGADQRNNPEAKAVVENIRAKGFEPEGYTLNTYAIIQSWAQAVEKTKSTKYKDLVKNLKSDEFSTVMGHVRFDKKGDFNGPGFVTYKWSNGTYAPAE